MRTVVLTAACWNLLLASSPANAFLGNEPAGSFQILSSSLSPNSITTSSPASEEASMASLTLSEEAIKKPRDTDARKNSMLFGHNLSPTTYTLPKGTLTLGNFALGYGVTDHFTLATSPWLLASYNMYSVMTRFEGGMPSDWKGATDDERRWGLQLAYFKTERFYPDLYQMEAAAGWFTVKQELAPIYAVNLCVNYMYFFDETLPFSLRREPNNGDAYQWSITTLQEIRLPFGLGLLAEIGALGLNYVYPQAFFGASMSHRTKHTLVQVGFSQNRTISGFTTLYTQNQGRRLDASAAYDSSMHPEIQFQAFF